MQQFSQPGLKSMLAEATLALAHLDAERLEEMALSCAALVRAVHWNQCEAKNPCEAGFGEGLQEMAIFARVVEATKANLRVMRKLSEVRATQIEYGPALAASGSGKSEHGNN
jgi:hypothetical protein